MKRSLFILSIIIQVTWSQSALELNTLLMNCTFKVEGDKRLGTAFIIGRPMRSDPKRAYYVLLTANHVLDTIKSDVATLHLRVKTEKSYRRLPTPLKIRHAGRPLWVKHPEVDVAAMYVSLPDEVQFDLLPHAFLATDTIFKQFEIHPGDQLFSLGYPYGAEANDVGFPILRSGHIASYPLLPIKLVKKYLFDFQVFGGNSGGPVYFVESNRRYGGTTHLGETIQFIAGLVSEERIVRERVTTLAETRETKYPLALAVVVHAQYILETIELLPRLD